MPLPVPVLDDRRFDDLMAEARALIPAHQPDWTDHNVSDPGIALLELFAWLAEMLIYRADQIPAAHLEAFRVLLTGPGADPAASLADAVLAARAPGRVVSAADFERAALAVAHVERARCVPGRDLSQDTPEGRAAGKPGAVSVIVVDDGASGAAGVLAAVAAALEPQRLLTTRVVVAPPVWTPVVVRVLLARPSDVADATARAAVTDALVAFLDARSGGPAGGGWPFGRAVYASEQVDVLAALPAVDHVVDLVVGADEGSAGSRLQPARVRLAEDGMPIALDLDAAALPGPDAVAVTVTSGVVFVPVTATVSVHPPSAPADGAALRGVVARAVRDAVWPGRGAPSGAGTSPWTLAAADLAVAARAVPVPAGSSVSVELSAEPSRMHADAHGDPTVALGARELVELTVEVDLT